MLGMRNRTLCLDGHCPNPFKPNSLTAARPCCAADPARMYETANKKEAEWTVKVIFGHYISIDSE
jgi:hypothetical protein